MEKILYYQLSKTAIFNKLKSSNNGLNSEEAKERLNKNGPNKLPEEKALSGLRLFLSQFKNPLVLILIVALTISYIAGHKSDALIILFVVLITNIVGFLQEWKANNALKKLNNTVVYKVKVRRNKEIKARYNDFCLLWTNY